MKTRNTRLQNILEIAGIALLAGLLVYTFVQWSVLPDRIPAHWNGAGQADRIGSKNELFIVPAFTIVMYAFLTAISRLSRFWSLPATATEENRAYLYSATRTIIIVSKLCVEVVFFLITVFIASQRVAWIWFDCVPVAVLLVFIVLYNRHVAKKANKMAHPGG